jgi:3-dehydroquinate synthase
MPSFQVVTPQRCYPAVVERGILRQTARFLPERPSRIFVVTTRDVWQYHGARLREGMAGRSFEVLFFPGGEERKRLAEVEKLAEEMVRRGGDRSSVVAAFGGGIVSDVAGFLAAIFMRGIPVLQLPTTLLAQVDAGVGGKTGVNLVSGKNLIGAFHQPLAVLIDPEVLLTLPEREYRAGLYEVIKCGVIRSLELFLTMSESAEAVLDRSAPVLDAVIAESVRIKAEVVSADEREGGLRRILNFGHTFGHALEAETGYCRFLHGEAVAWGMRAAVYLAEMLGRLSPEDSAAILHTISLYGPIPPLNDIAAERIVARMAADKKTRHGQIHFVLPERIGQVSVVSGVDPKAVLAAVEAALQ